MARNITLDPKYLDHTYTHKTQTCSLRLKWKIYQFKKKLPMIFNQTFITEGLLPKHTDTHTQPIRI